MKETEVGEAVAAEFRAEGWDVFCEVRIGANYPICDLVARRGSLLWAVECKTTRSIDVLDQAAQWLGCAHLVSVAVPSRSRVELRRLQFILSGITSAQARKEIREEIKGLRKMLSRDPAAVAEDVCNAFRIASRERRVSVATRTERTRLRRLRENPAWGDFEE